ncbi:MAG TPA: ABC transporter ATP-binding protein, partial [Modicisalibacter sp.]|nr:ABC transporter ATP-binding protein [Modicisalibacter sp.]
ARTVSKQAKSAAHSESVASDATPSPRTEAEPASKKPVKLSYKLQRELDGLPATIEALERSVADFEAQVGDPGFYQQDSDEIARTLEAMSNKQAELDTAMERWMELEAMAGGQ